MLLINGVITLLGLILALVVYTIRIQLDVTGIPLIFVGALALWIYLFLSDVIEDKLIELFNKETPDGHDRTG